MGKGAVQEAKPVGKLAKTIAAPYKADRACHLAMRNTIQKALSGLEQAAQKPSILKTMREQNEKAKAEPPKEASPKHAER